MTKEKSRAATNQSVVSTPAEAAKLCCIAAIKQTFPGECASQEGRLLPVIAITCVQHSLTAVARGYEIFPTAPFIISKAIQKAQPQALTNCKLSNLMQHPLLSKVFTRERRRYLGVSRKQFQYAIDMKLFCQMHQVTSEAYFLLWTGSLLFA